ncbi:unnamed protein product [Chrysoparadoxa australica]
MNFQQGFTSGWRASLSGEARSSTPLSFVIFLTTSPNTFLLATLEACVPSSSTAKPCTLQSRCLTKAHVTKPWSTKELRCALPFPLVSFTRDVLLVPAEERSRAMAFLLLIWDSVTGSRERARMPLLSSARNTQQPAPSAANVHVTSSRGVGGAATEASEAALPSAFGAPAAASMPFFRGLTTPAVAALRVAVDGFDRSG